MTIAVIWQEESFLWAVADTRFSRVSGADAQRITDHGPKLLPLTVVIRQPSASGFFDSVRFQTTLGFLYAGATAPALSTHALCTAALQNLITDPEHALPTLASIARFVGRTAERYMIDWGQNAPNHACFSAFVFGWCGAENALQAFHILPKIKERLIVDTSRVDLREPVAIGSGARDFKLRLDTLRHDGDKFGRTSRLPLLAVESLIADGTRDDIGGDIQLGYANQAGLQIASRCRPQTRGKPHAVMTFLGIDVLEIGPVGSCAIGMSGIA